MILGDVRILIRRNYDSEKTIHLYKVSSLWNVHSESSPLITAVIS
jgi:hypothetical protein